MIAVGAPGGLQGRNRVPAAGAKTVTPPSPPPILRTALSAWSAVAAVERVIVEVVEFQPAIVVPAAIPVPVTLIPTIGVKPVSTASTMMSVPAVIADPPPSTATESPA